MQLREEIRKWLNMAKSQAEAKGISDFQHVVDGSKGNSDVFMVPAIH